MQKFEFSPSISSSSSSSSTPRPSKFSGRNFYSVYKDAEFLRDSNNIVSILSRGYQLRNMLKEVESGVTIIVGDMKLNKDIPLMVKNSGLNVKVEDFEFTSNRLTGLVAAYVFENRHLFPDINASEASTLGLKWDHTDKEKCKLYLSAVTGTEHFHDQFSFWPLVCALRKFKMSKFTPELVIKLAKIKNNDGEKLSKEFRMNGETVLRLWKQFPGATGNELADLLTNAPPNIVKALKEN